MTYTSSIPPCEIKKPEITFFGMRWGRDGVKPDPEKCDRIQSKPAPTNVKELQSFLDLLQYMAPFIPHLSSKSDILRKLLRSDTEFDWTEDHERAFKDLKSMINEEVLQPIGKMYH